MAEKTQGPFLELLAGLRTQPAVYVDETSWWMGKPGYWLWTLDATEGRTTRPRRERPGAARPKVREGPEATPPERTVYRVERRRGKDVVFDTPGAHFAGVLTGDGLAGYENLPYVLPKGYAHPLKAIAAARDRKPEDQRSYFHERSVLLHAAMTLERLRGDLSPPEFARIRQHLDPQADALILPTRADPDEERVANPLRKRRQWLFTLLDHPGVEASNNRAERALRPAVIAPKFSCGNKTERGKRTWETLASLAATCTQRRQDLVEFLRPNLLLPNPFPAR